MALQIDLNQAIFALSDALDLVGMSEVAHGKRVGYMAFKCAESLEYDAAQRENMFVIGLLHDCGVSSTRIHQFLVNELQWEHDADHAFDGAELLQTSRLLKHHAVPVRYHHEPWSSLKNIEGPNQFERIAANSIFLVDRVDALAAPHYLNDLHNHIEPIRDKIRSYSGDLFQPELVEIFLEVSAADSFWLMLEPPHLERFIYDTRQRFKPYLIEGSDVRDIATIFARIVDAKSAFTFEHSEGVAHLSRFLADTLGLDENTQEKLEIAGLLHDLGKLRIPDEVLDKRGSLSKNEEFMMHSHSFETYQVLRQVRGFEDIALWSAYHHEKPDGSGYPFKRHGNDLSLEARIIAVADIFQALAQNRPYRKAMPLKLIGEILQDQVAQGLLDSRVVGVVINRLFECHDRAVGFKQTDPASADLAS